jgi:hypothetical protein
MVKVLDYKTGTENRAESEKLVSLRYSCWPLRLTIEKDLAGPKARLTLLECFSAEQRGCGAPPE